MAEQQKPESKIRSMDTTKTAIRESYLDPIAKQLGKTYHAGETLKLAFIAFAADCAGLAKGSEDRKKFFAQLDATPGWFGNGNNSACRQSFESKSDVEEAMKDYSKM